MFKRAFTMLELIFVIVIMGIIGKFGTEFLMAKQYPKDDIKKILKDYTLKFNDQSIFVIT